MKEIKMTLMSMALKRCKNTAEMYIKKINQGFSVEGKDEKLFNDIIETINELEERINE